MHPWKYLCSEWGAGGGSEKQLASLLDHIEEAHISVTEGLLFLRHVTVGLSVQDLTGDERRSERWVGLSCSKCSLCWKLLSCASFRIEKSNFSSRML